MVPLPVTILKPRLSSMPAWRRCRPEMISASLGSATRHMLLKTSTISSTNRTAAKAPSSTSCETNPVSMIWFPSCARSDRADNHGSRREVLDHDHPGALAYGLLGVGGVGVEALAAATNGDHHLAQPPGPDPTGDTA